MDTFLETVCQYVIRALKVFIFFNSIIPPLRIYPKEITWTRESFMHKDSHRFPMVKDQ